MERAIIIGAAVLFGWLYFQAGFRSTNETHSQPIGNAIHQQYDDSSRGFPVNAARHPVHTLGIYED